MNKKLFLSVSTILCSLLVSAIAHAQIFTISVNETVPFTLNGEPIYTYCQTGGFTLNVVSTPFTPPLVQYVWNDGTTSTTVATATYSPTYTPGSTTAIHVYTVTMQIPGTLFIPPVVLATTTVSVAVPRAGCSPCDFYNVNAYRTLDGVTPTTVPGCTDCSTTKPFRTITASSLTSTNIADNANYYILNNASIEKSAINGDMFYVDASVQLTVTTVNPVAIDGSHFYSRCGWAGIIVPVGSTPGTSAQFTITNSLVEGTSGANAGVMINSGNYYYPGMSDILDCHGNIFNLNNTGLSIRNYAPPIYDPSFIKYPFNIYGCVFTSRKLESYFDPAAPSGYYTTAANNYPFSWPTTTRLNSNVTGSCTPHFFLSNYTASTVQNSGIWLTNIGKSAIVTGGSGMIPDVYGYNYIEIGQNTADPGSANANLFDNEKFGIRDFGSNVHCHNNTFLNITLSSINYQVDAAHTSNINDLMVVGDNDASVNTNNRFYNTGFGISTNNNFGSPRDLTCDSAVFADTTNTTGTCLNIYKDGTKTSGVYNITNNYMYNCYGGGVIMGVYGATNYTTLNGATNIDNNTIIGKTGASWGESLLMGISYNDTRYYVSPGVVNGSVSIQNNTFTGVRSGISFNSRNAAGTINGNNVLMPNYATASYQTGIGISHSQFLQVQQNVVKGFGFDCQPASGYNTIGVFGTDLYVASSPTTVAADISCNSVVDVNEGFLFNETNLVNWHDNQMMRNNWGLFFGGGASIGQQGSPGSPSNNHWDDGSSSAFTTSCGSTWPLWSGGYPYIMQMYFTPPSYVSLSPIYVSSVTTTPSYTYDFVGNNFASPTPPDIRGTGGATPPYCTPYTGLKEAPPTTSIATVIASDAYSLYPNPNDGSFTISQGTQSTAPVAVSIYDMLGRQVYHSQMQFEDGKATILLNETGAGLYLLQVSDNNGVNWNKKITVVK